jgi:hypothetical protein
VAVLTAQNASHELEVVIEFGELASQHAPGGHPVFRAIEKAREWLSWLEEYGPTAAPILAPGSRVYGDIAGAIDAVQAAVATLRDDGSQTTVWRVGHRALALDRRRRGRAPPRPGRGEAPDVMIPLISEAPTMGGCNVEGCPGYGSLIPSWVTPGNIRDEEDSIDAAVRTLDADITATGSVALVAAWRAFRAGWDEFYAGEGGVTGWFGRFLSSSSLEKALDYRKQLEAWRARYMQEGGNPSGPGLVPKPKPDTSSADMVRYAAIAAVALGAVYVVSQTGILRGLGGALSPAPRTNPRRRRRR